MDESVVIQSGDTLYDIAATNRPDTSVSVEQTMLAIQRNNPDAFIDNDINRIRVGQIIRIPSIQEIASIDQTQALNQIALQNQASTTQPLALSDNDPAGSQQGTDELTILSGDEGSDSLSGDSDLAEAIAALENQLAISEENLDRARLENVELMARFADLEDQIEILQNIIAMQDVRLAQLQADLAADLPEAEEPVVAQPQQVANIAQTDGSLMGRLSNVFENTLVLVAGLVGLILLVVGFLVWRRQAAQSEMNEFDLGGAAVASGPEAFEAEKGGLLAKLKGIFSRSSDEDNDFTDDVYEEDDELESEDFVSEGSASEELDGGEEVEDSEKALAFDGEEDDVDFGLDDAVDTAETSEAPVEDGEAEEVESFDFSLDENEDESATGDEPEEQALEDVENFDFNAEVSAAIEEPVQEVSTPDAEVESFDLDVGSVSSFEEETDENSDENEDSADDDVVEIDDGEEISFGEQSNDEDPLAAALNEIDAESDQGPDGESGDESPENEDHLDLGNIDIDDSLFEASESDEVAEPITDRDESSTKLDLAVAYEAMGDIEGAREILNEVIDEGNDGQVAEAKKLQEKWEQS